MVGIVIVSHSEKVAQGVAELCKQMAAAVTAAMGMDLDMVLQRASCPSCNKYA